MRVPTDENGDSFESWIDGLNNDITLFGSVNIRIRCIDGEWVPTYIFDDGGEYSPIEAYYDSLEDAALLTAQFHIFSSKTNRTIQSTIPFDPNNITDDTELNFLIEEERH